MHSAVRVTTSCVSATCGVQTVNVSQDFGVDSNEDFLVKYLVIGWVMVFSNALQRVFISRKLVDVKSSHFGSTGYSDHVENQLLQ